MTTWNKIMVWGITLMALFCAWLCRSNQTLRNERDRLEANQTTLLEKASYYETELGKSAASVQRLTLTKSELEHNYKDVCQRADELGVKLKRMQAAAQTATQTEVKVETQLRDTIIYRDVATVDTLKVFNWNDAWVNVDGEIKGCEIALDVQSCDTIQQIVHRVPKKWWFFKWGTKAIRQEVVSTNPHTKITYTEYIEIR